MTVVVVLLLLLAAVVLACAVFGFIIAYRIYHPYSRRRREPKLDGLDVTSTRIPSGPGIELDAMLLRAADSRQLVIVAHELGAVKESKIKIARRLVASGFNVLLFDLRNHGESSRDRSLRPMSEKFTDDVEAALRYARKIEPPMETISLFTFSFSTFPSLYIINRDIEPPDAIILDSGPSVRIDDLFSRFLDSLGRHFVPGVFRLPVIYGMLKFWARFFGTHMLATTWPPDFSGMRSRVLFLVNGADTIFEASQIVAVAERMPHKQMWTCPDAIHLQGYRCDPDGYEGALLGFLSANGVRPG